MSFGEAIENVKKGYRIARKGWNGKNQYVILCKMELCITSENETIVTPRHDNVGDSFLMFVGSSGYQCGWLASQADMLADDWEVV